ncbi:MAG: ABC transporter ATP-binding protein [Promethearchaeota archaeon]
MISKMIDNIVLEINNLRGYYRGTFGTIYAIDNVSFKVKKGEILGIAGESGCGKSTLIELITGLPRPLLHYEQGSIIVNGYNIYEIDKEILRTKVLCKILGCVPQAALNSLNPVKKIKNLIYDVMRERTGRKPNKQEVSRFVISHFKTIGLDKSILSLYPHELSGGMKQRTVIGIATLWNPNLLIVDEPTSALDVTTQKLVINMLLDLKKKNVIETILYISHDLPTLAQICSRCIIMYAGEIVEDGRIEDILRDPLHPYTKGLLSSIASFNPDGTAETELCCILGKPPDLRYPPPGCRFHPRCPNRMDLCRVNPPPYFFPKGKERPVKCWLYLDSFIKKIIFLFTKKKIG